MDDEVSCSSCSMVFSDNIRLERHVKKDHPTKQKIDPIPHLISTMLDFSHNP